MIPAGAFPLLTTDNHRITSAATRTYNCIAWAASDTSKWWWPDELEIGYWPPAALREESLRGFVDAFRCLGYENAPDATLESDFEKIAIFAIGDRPTHAARQLPSGKWTSKLGNDEDIEHDWAVLDGPAYGRAIVILHRPLPKP